MPSVDWLTAEIVRAGTGATAERAAQWLPHILQACEAWDIDTPARMAAFLAQIGHESGGLRWVSEIWNPAQVPAQARYEGRIDLGNTQPGDGERFKGHGLIQITGRANHAAARDGLRERLFEPPDFETFPEALTEPRWAALSAAWYWHSRKLNALADAGSFEQITRKINGGLNGQADRVARWEAAKAALTAVVPTPQPATRTADVSTPAAPAIERTANSSTSPPFSFDPTTPQEAPMAPFLLAALPAIIDAVPKLGQLFSSGSQTAERNIKAVETVVAVAKEAIGAVNEQELVERLQSDPAAAIAVRDAVHQNWFEISQAQEKSIAAAREFAVSYSKDKDVRTVWKGFTFPEFLSLIFVLVSAVGAVVVLTDLGAVYSPEIKGSVITLMLIAGYTGVREFWFGSSPVEQAKANRPG